MKISVDIDLACFINLAFQQNKIPVVRTLNIKNESEQDFKNIKCIFSSEPNIILPYTLEIDMLKSNQEYFCDKIDLNLNYEMLASLSEMVECKLSLQILDQEELIYSSDHQIQAYAPDQWLGASFFPELIVAFVTPNLNVINDLQVIVAQELKKKTGSASIQGYQQDKKRVYEICAAIYRAIHSMDLTYSNPRASMGTPGQRIRFADAISKYRFATCLDSTLLFASLMEQCGLHPVIMLQKGHAYIGCHLEEIYFADIPMDDLQTIRKAVDLDMFLIFETTMVCGNNTFSEAELAAKSKYLNIDDDFIFAIDVIRARNSGIRPLPLTQSTAGFEFSFVKDSNNTLIEETHRKLQNNIDLSSLNKSNDSKGRINRWTQKLLDLSLRNRLLNLKDNQQSIPLFCPNISNLEDKIAANEAIAIGSCQNLLSEKDLYDLTLIRNSEVKNEIKYLLDNELKQRRLWTTLAPNERVKRLINLYRKSKNDLEEGGVNTLFLALGFLEWKRSENENQSYFAPILLVPIKLERRSVNDDIKICRLDEDTIVNETLLELLRSQFGISIPGLDPLPTDDNGVDVELIMQIFRQSVKDFKGWEVREEARIGYFSFSKFVMWSDMTTRLEELKENELVNHLISGGGLFDDNIEVFDPKELNNHLKLGELYCPMSADSSQLTAILYSQLGKNFVLHGPPGTGKSQTITNIIAHNLALNKRVLFVSEKKAALEVVYRRLTSIGLGAFCLELHSNKSGKAEVLAQFEKALNTPTIAQNSEEYNSTLSTLEPLEKTLALYSKELHHVYNNNMSIYDCLQTLLKFKPNEMIFVDFDSDCINDTPQHLENLKSALADFISQLKNVDSQSLHALSFLENNDWSPALERNIQNIAQEILEATQRLVKVLLSESNEFGLSYNSNIDIIYNNAVYLESLKSLENLPATLLDENFEANCNFLSEFKISSNLFFGYSSQLSSFNLDVIKNLDIDQISERIQKNKYNFFIVAFFKNRKLCQELSGIKKLGGIKLTIAELEKYLELFKCFINSKNKYDSEIVRAKGLLGDMWNNEQTEWGDIEIKLNSLKDVMARIESLCSGNTNSKELLLTKIKDILPQCNNLLASQKPLRNKINLILDCYNNFYDKQQKFYQLIKNNIPFNNLTEIENVLSLIIANIGNLRDVIMYKKLAQKLQLLGAEKYIIALTNNELNSDNALNVLEYNYHRKMIEEVLEKSPILSNFIANSHEEKIKKCLELHNYYTALSKRYIISKLSKKLPKGRSGNCPNGTELGIIKRECEKKSRHKPVRKLLEQTPIISALLKPCFLMSPLSVAQYLPPDTEKFDILIFDEASQIPVWDAIGAISRAKQVIVVGDPKQMPPTNFFQKGDNSEEQAMEEIEDMESILDECLAAGVHSAYLNWHYRSRHESLISFSNHYYYEDKLFTFPSAQNNEQLGVSLKYISNGVYDRKNSRTNQLEAESLVKYIFTMLKDPAQCNRTMGVVTFSQSQQELIEDLVEKALKENPELMDYFSDQKDEPFFVKNLENVQGDERDIILFSICYAQDNTGKLSMNFGPLNRQGGERRLNVAITRAKEQVVVFSSITSGEIELSRTNATGAAHLKKFLAFAEKGFTIHGQDEKNSNNELLLDHISKILTAEGYVVTPNLGCSNYKIDIAVSQKDSPNNYFLAIELDGPNYANEQLTIKDRDILRNQILNSLNWHTYRIWSMDWFFNSKKAQEQLLTFIKNIELEPVNVIVEKIAEPIIKVVEPDSNVCYYRMWISKKTYFSEDFLLEKNSNIISEQIAEIIQAEAPITMSLLQHRIAKAWNISRITKSVSEKIESSLPRDIVKTKSREGDIVWRVGQSTNSNFKYRVSKDCQSQRAIDEIPPEELANGMFSILEQFSSCEQDTLYRETLKLFNLSALTSKARKFLDLAFAILKRENRI